MPKVVDYVREPGPIEEDLHIEEPGPNAALIIDNGSSRLRTGWSSQQGPGVQIDSLTSKWRERKANKIMMVTGMDVYADSGSRANIRSPFELDLVCNGDAMEMLLDSAFLKMGLTGTITQPVVLSETLNNARYSRQLTSELLFEAYNVPSIAYGVDSLFSFYGSGHSDGIVVKSGTSTSHVIPVVGGKPIHQDASRLSWGALPASQHLLKLEQVKYPTFPVRLNVFQANAIYKDHCVYATDFDKELAQLSDPATLAASDVTIQFPFVPLEPKSEEELERIAQRKRDAGRRLQEQANRQRREKLSRLQDDLDRALQLKAIQSGTRKADFEKKLKSSGYSNVAQLDAFVTKTEVAVQKLQEKVDAFLAGKDPNKVGIEIENATTSSNESDDKKDPASTASPISKEKEKELREQEEKELYPLLTVPDSQLSEEELKEKRKQRLLKAGADARLRAREEREREHARIEAELQKDRDFRATDPAGWIASKRKLLSNVNDRIRDRKKRREQLQDRKSLVAQQRMRSIANLANEGSGGADSERSGGSGSSGRRTRGSHQNNANADADDGFGRNDDDWAVYREITNADDSEDEEEDQKTRSELETLLLNADPDFTIEDTAERKEFHRHALFNAFYYGLPPDPTITPFDINDPEAASQIHINVERIRVPECLFSPTLAGIDQWGLSDIVKHAFTSNPSYESLAKCVYVTGGNTLLPNFDQRLYHDLRSTLNAQTPLNILRPTDPRLLTDSWRGMAAWARDQQTQGSLASSSVSKALYDECGPDYLVEHSMSNKY